MATAVGIYLRVLLTQGQTANTALDLYELAGPWHRDW